MVVLYRLYSTVRRHSTYIVFNQVVTTASIALVAGQAFSDLLMDGCPGPREIGARRPRSPESHLLLTMETAVTSRRSQAFDDCEKIPEDRSCPWGSTVYSRDNTITTCEFQKQSPSTESAESRHSYSVAKAVTCFAGRDTLTLERRRSSCLISANIDSRSGHWSSRN